MSTGKAVSQTQFCCDSLCQKSVAAEAGRRDGLRRQKVKYDKVNYHVILASFDWLIKCETLMKH